MKETEPTPQEIFVAAIQLKSAEQLREYLNSACGDDAKLRTEVDALLSAHQQAGSFLGEYEPSIETQADASVGESRMGQTIGPYKLLEVIGEGGMGTVYMARQTEPVSRRVAVKLIKTGMDTHQVVARFEAERQALAMMDHPNIARVLDAGATDSGRPYFVMELVRGKPITKFCDELKLDLESRLRLFQQVCHAIQHAHQKGIIHRDIKPSNVLIAMYDDKPVPKVIDFGVAKATGEELTEKTMFTRFGQIVGTLEYMSPEQAQFNNLDIDTRSDIYSLGAILYELLTGVPPFEHEIIRNQPLDETLRMIREDEPTKPSTKLSSTARSSQIASNRKTSVDKLGAILRGDLDWIVMKALDKDRTRRYETANGLALDVQRYLNNEMVSATPPSTVYRLQKFLQKHRMKVAAVATIFLILLAAIIGTSWSLQKTLAAKKLANDRWIETKKANFAKDQALKQSQESQRHTQAIADFVSNDFLGLTSVQGQSRFADGEQFSLSKDTTLRELLDRAADKLQNRDDLDPESVAELAWMIGVNYRGLGEYDLAVDYLEWCLDLRREFLGPDHFETVNAINSLALAHDKKGEFDSAIPLYKEALEKSRGNFEGEDVNEYLPVMSNLASAYVDTDRLDLAIPLYEECYQIAEEIYGADNVNVLSVANGLGLAHLMAGNLELATKILKDTFEKQSVELAPDHYLTLTTMHNLGRCYRDMREYDLATPLLEECLELRKRVLGEQHPDTFSTLQNLASCYRATQRLDLSASLHEEVLNYRKQKLGDTHPETIISMNELGLDYLQSRRFDKAIPLFEKCISLGKEQVAEDHPHLLTYMHNLAISYRAAGKLELAMPLFEKTLELRQNKFGHDHAETYNTMHNMAVGYRDSGQLDRAINLLEKALEGRQALLRKDHPAIFETIGQLATTYLVAGKPELALPLSEQLLEDRSQRLGPTHRKTITAIVNLARCYQDTGDQEQANQQFEKVLQIQMETLEPDADGTLITMNNLALGYQRVDELDKALPLFEEASAGIEKKGFKHFYTERIIGNTISAYEKAEQFEAADGWRRKFLNVVKLKSGAKSPVYSSQLALFGLQLLNRQEWAAAEEVIRESLEIREQIQPDTWSTFNAKAMLGAALLGQEKYADAEPLLVQGYKGMKEREQSIPAAGRVRLDNALDRLIELYTATDDGEQLNKWQTEKIDRDKLGQ